MNKTSKITQSTDYVYFRSSVPLKNICVENSKGQSWKVFDAGPKSVRCPMIFLPPACGTADLFFRQLLELSGCGYRVLSVESPNTYWTVTDWCIGFMLLLDHLGLEKVHLFGASLGGFLAQKFAESTNHRPRVLSLFLCNTFADTEIFDFTETASLFWMFPQMILRRLIYTSLVTNSSDPDIRDAVEFVAERSNTLRRTDLASRLTINCISSHVNPANVRNLQSVTIMDVFDDYALNSPVREEIYEYYPRAKKANLKCGGNYPYLSKYAEVNVHLKIHLLKYQETPYSATVNRDIPRENVEFHEHVETNTVEENEDNEIGQSVTEGYAASQENDYNEMKENNSNREYRNTELWNESSDRRVEVEVILENEGREFPQPAEEYTHHVQENKNDHNEAKESTDERRDTKHQSELSDRLIEENTEIDGEGKALIPQNVTELNTDESLT